ncbi:MAG: glycosyltransferase [Anaerolineae bacterium]|nr:glycosyltransferase [Anaerolineae bacterium]
MDRPDISIIIPAYQAGDIIGMCVSALNQQTFPRDRYEILVVDDASTDSTPAAAAEAGSDRVLTIAHQGPSGARNAGVAAALGEIVLFTDADCIPGPEWIARMTAPFADPDVMGAKGTYRTRQPELMARLVQLEFEIRYERMAHLPQIDFVDTYAAAYRRSLLQQCGGFDTAFPVPSAEDVELSFRLAREGNRFVFVPEAWVWHRHPGRLRQYLLRKGRYGYWRALLYLRYPEKASGDAHTDPMLKAQFVTTALWLLLLAGGLLWSPLWVGASVMLGAFLLTTLPFVRWAWKRDRAVALVWPGVTLLRSVIQGIGLAWGLVWHGVLSRS